jgi:hypothetical protein
VRLFLPGLAALLRLALRVAAVALGLLALPYWLVPAYDFPPARPFSGARWHNPYAGGSGPWRTGNFHSHARAWGGLTAGADSREAMVEAYRRHGRELVALSDYHSLPRPAAGEFDVRAYEHGYGVRKTHRLVLGAQGVHYLDVPWPSLSTSQWLLHTLRAQAGAVALPHPGLLDGYTCEDLKRLTGFELLEVASSFGVFEAQWDCALSAGRPVWGLGADDAHAAADWQLGLCFTVVRSASDRAPDVLRALTAGQAYAACTKDGQLERRVESVQVDEDVLQVALDGPARTVRFVGQGGREVGRAVDTALARQPLGPEDTYVRAVVETPHTTLFLNPVVRAGPGELERPVAQVALGATALQWGLVLAVGAAALRWGWLR